jgi:hypothetical protein
MSLLLRPAHGVLRLAVAGARRRFLQDSRSLRDVQSARLRELRALAPQAFAGSKVDPWAALQRLPVTSWSDWRGRAEACHQTGGSLVDSPVQRWQPTSGSTSAVKLVPYTRAFLGELDAAIGPWLGDMYRQHPAIAGGRHYWSLSWVPTELRARFAADLNDDAQLLSAGKRVLSALTQAVPARVALAETSDDSLFATLVYLAGDTRLAMLSVWSPTFALSLLERLGHWREPVAEVLASGRWPARLAGLLPAPAPQPLRAAALRGWDGVPDPGFFAAFWPCLALVSSWDTASAAGWAARLREWLPQAGFQGKGLWATEGVVTIPFAGLCPLAYRSHVCEFEDSHGEILPPWALRRGQQVVPVISTGSGLLRYRLQDVLEVEAFLGEVPCLRFLGRNDGTDLVGEKMSAVHAQQVLASLPLPPGMQAVTLLAAADTGDGRPGYLLLLDADPARPASGDQLATLAGELEARLAGQFHYRLARDLGQLRGARVAALAGMREHYTGMRVAHGMIEGNVKVEPLTAWLRPLPEFLRGTTGAAVPAGVA